MNKKLYRSETDKKICGVCAGVGESFEIDPTLVRLGWTIVSLFAGCGIVLYIVAALVVPKKPMV